jgi:hypothetical protein
MSEARIPWPVLLAHKRGAASDLSSVPAPTAAPLKPNTVAPVPQSGFLSTTPHFTRSYLTPIISFTTLPSAILCS